MTKYYYLCKVSIERTIKELSRYRFNTISEVLYLYALFLAMFLGIKSFGIDLGISPMDMGSNLEGKDVLVVDDMIASGESILDIAYELKKRKAGHVYIAVTFAFFTEGYDEIDKAFAEGVIDRIYTTNLSYLPESCKQKEWLYEVDMSNTIATVIDNMNYDLSLTPLFDTHIRLKNLELFHD